MQQTLQGNRRAINSGFVAGITLIFLILIGIPGGASDADGLPAWFAWGLFMVVVGAFAWTACRARNPVEDRAQTLAGLLPRGAIIGTIAAALFVGVACGLNAFQLWELQQPVGGVPLQTGLQNKIARVQDIFANVTPRSTAVLAALPYEAIKTPDGTPRADPTLRFFLTACLLPLAGLLGVGGYWVNRAARWRRTLGRGNMSGLKNANGNWAIITLPLVFLGFIVFNYTFKDVLGANAQLAGLLASFLLIASGLLAVRSAAGDEEIGSFGRRLALTLPITLVLMAVALLAPARPPTDLFFSPRTDNTIQTQEDGQVKITVDKAPQIETSALLSLRTMAFIVIGLLFVLGDVVASRAKSSLKILVALNILLGALVVAPLYMDTYQQSVLVLIGINILLGLGLNIVVGYAGLLDLGYVAFFAIGAYTYAFLSSNQDIRQGGQIIALKFAGNDQAVQRVAAMLIIGAIITVIVISAGLFLARRNAVASTERKPASRWLGPGLVALSVLITLIVINILSSTPLYQAFAGFPAFLIGIVVGVMFAAFAGVALGIPVLRLRGDYLAIVTLGFGEIIRLFLNNVKDVTGGPQGLLNIPKLTVGNIEVGSNEGLVYVVLAGCILIALLSLRLRSSRLGRSWGALRSDEDIAQAMGINLVNTKVLAFAIGAGFAGLGGVIFAARQANIFPDNFTLQVSINILALVIIGGMGSVPGVVVGALVLIGIPESLRVFEAYRILAFGALLVAMMLLRPGGLLPQPPQPMEARARGLKENKAAG
jgi:ABC-type branched-subunit amino acid transport system permease subunit